MSEIKRRGIEFLANQIGLAKYAFKNLIGNNTSIKAALLDYENNYTKIKGSSIFFDYDISRKNPIDSTASSYLTYDKLDNTSFSLQGGNLVISSSIAGFAISESWTPERNGPPSPEGWGIYEYNAWSNFIPPYTSSGTANTNYIIYNTLFEPGSGVSRTAYDYPVRYTGINYQQVELFNFARYISVKNTTGSTKTEAVVVVPKTYFDGCLHINPYTNTPKDLAIYSHQYLISDKVTIGLTLAGAMGQYGISDTLNKLAFQVTECGEDGTTQRVNNYYKFNVKLPGSATWTNNYWFHMVFYWGTHDTYFQQSYPTYSSGTATGFGNTNLNTNWYIYPKKSFFLRNLSNTFEFNKTGVNDTNIYLFNSLNTLRENKESVYLAKSDPFRYKLNETISGGSTAATNSISDFATLQSEDFLPIVIASKNDGNLYDSPNLDLEVFVGAAFPYSEVPNKWEDFTYYPSIPKDYNIICKMIGSYPSSLNSGTSKFYNTSNYISNNISIVFIEMVARNVINESIGDIDLVSSIVNSLIVYSERIRSNKYSFFFSQLARRIVTRASRYDVSKIRKQYHFEDNSTLEYKALHNLIKSPSATSLQNDNNVEPLAIQFDNQALEVIKDYATDQPSKIVASYNPEGLTIDSENLSYDSEFEIYQEKYNPSSFDIVATTGNKLQKDYSFKIKFRTSDNQFVIKDVNVNSSEYYLTDSEYDLRVKNKQSVLGYFKASTLSNVEDYRLYGNAAFIPDLKMEVGRQIFLKQNNPADANRLTEAQYESLLVSANPTINNTQIAQAKVGFGCTDSFLVVDSSKPSEKFNGIDVLGVTVSNYSLNTTRYWIDNTKALYGETQLSDVKKPISYLDLFNDSFIIAGSGYSIGFGNANLLENIGEQKITISAISTQQQNGTQSIANNKVAIRILPSSNTKIKGFRLKLKKTSDYINSHATINAELWSSKNDLPYEKLAVGEKVYLKNISNILSEYDFTLEYSLFKNNVYWVVIDTTNLPPTYDPFVAGSINIDDTSVTGIFNPVNNTYANFSRYNNGAELGIGSTNGDLISNWYEISSIGSSTTMTVAGTGQTLYKQNYSIRYSFGMGITESSATGASTNLAKYSSALGWTSYEGTAFIEFFQPDVEIFGGFNKDFSESTNILPAANRYRESSPNYVVDEYWSFNNLEMFEQDYLYIYPRSVSLQQRFIPASGSAGTNYFSIKSKNYNENILVGTGISLDTYIIAGTSITSIQYVRSTDVYNVYLSSNILSSFSETNVGIGTEQTFYSKRANNIYISFKYDSLSGLGSTLITLPKSSGWDTKFYSRNKFNYSQLDKTIKANYNSSSYNLNYKNYNVDSSYSYFNGYSIGDFTVKSSLGSTFDFKFASSYGLRVFVNNSSTASIDKWKIVGGVGYTEYSFSHNLSGAGGTVKFEVQFNNNSNIAGCGQTLIGYWRKSGTSTWSVIDNSFYQDSSLAPVLIAPDKIRKIVFMSVGKNQSDIDTSTQGMPPGDRLVFRSK
jgi:hypothetical protein